MRIHGAVLVGLTCGLLIGCDDGESPSVDAGAADAPTGQFFPCDVERVLEAKCRTCHKGPAPRPFGAPFELVDYAEVQRTDYAPPMRLWQVMKVAVETNFMPLAGSPTGPLTPDQKTTLLGWLTLGAPAASTRCPTGDGGS
jgi:hypothetical protein